MTLVLVAVGIYIVTRPKGPLGPSTTPVPPSQYGLQGTNPVLPQPPAMSPGPAYENPAAWGQGLGSLFSGIGNLVQSTQSSQADTDYGYSDNEGYY